MLDSLPLSDGAGRPRPVLAVATSSDREERKAFTLNPSTGTGQDQKAGSDLKRSSLRQSTALADKTISIENKGSSGPPHDSSRTQYFVHMIELMERAKGARPTAQQHSVVKASRDQSPQPGNQGQEPSFDARAPPKCISCIRNAITHQIDLHDKRDQVRKDKAQKRTLPSRAAPLAMVPMEDYNLESWRGNP